MLTKDVPPALLEEIQAGAQLAANGFINSGKRWFSLKDAWAYCFDVMDIGSIASVIQVGGSRPEEMKNDISWIKAFSLQIRQVKPFKDINGLMIETNPLFVHGRETIDGKTVTTVWASFYDRKLYVRSRSELPRGGWISAQRRQFDQQNRWTP